MDKNQARDGGADMSAEAKEQVIWADCAQCGGSRRCNVRGRFNKSDSDEYMQWWESWRILQCCGCEYIFVQKSVSDSESYTHIPDGHGDYTIAYDETTTYWPALAKRKRPEWMTPRGIDAPGLEKLDEALLELYVALDNDLLILGAIAIRTSFDVASELLKIEPNQTFEEKLTQLVEGGHIGKADRARIKTLVDAGSASAHRGWKPQAADLSVMAEILEHFVHDAFVAPARKARLDAKADEIKAQVPARQPKKPKVLEA